MAYTNEVFTVCLLRDGAPSAARATVSLPAFPYTLRDAMDKVRLREGDALRVEIESYHRCGFLSSLPTEKPDLPRLNLLAGKLAELDAQELKQFEGLALITAGEGENRKTLTMETLLDLASSTSAATLIPASTDEELGKYCVKHGLIPALKDLSEEAKEMLDYDKIGYVRRCMEAGTFLNDNRTYVVQSGELRHKDNQMKDTAREPDYTVMLMVKVPAREKPLPLRLPATTAEIDEALEHCPAVSWECVDCKVPALSRLLSKAESLDVVCNAALVLETIPDRDLPNYKALLESEGFYSLGEALGQLDHLDEYILTPEISCPEELAQSELSFYLDDNTLETLLPFVNMDAYGREIMRKEQLSMTEYGLFERKRDLCMEQKNEAALPQNNMTIGGM